MRHTVARSAFVALTAIGIVSCVDAVTAPNHGIRGPSASRTAIPLTGSKVVISQVYGGGGNGGSTWKNDFIELYNNTPAEVSLAGTSVQYASAGGTSWQVTPLSGTLQPGQYYLIQEAAQGGGTTSLPTPDASATIAMAAGAGKVALVDGTTALSGTGCVTTAPSTFPANVIDYVGYGTGTSGANCFEGTAPAPTIAAATADLRKSNGQQDTGNNGGDFTATTPNPRNTASPILLPADPLSATITASSPSAFIGDVVTYAVTARKDFNNVAITTATWSSSDPSVATIDPATGVAHGIAAGIATISVLVTTPVGTVSSTKTLTVSRPMVPSTTVVSELHYDNPGDDAGEAIEIEGDAGASLEGWSLVLYNATDGAVYNTRALSGTIPATCGARGVVVLNYPFEAGIQNGPSDGWALVNADGAVTEFRSYEGTLTARSGPALGLVSTEIEANEGTPDLVTQSVQRAGNGVWFGPATSTFGSCNADEPPPPPPPPGSMSVQPRSAPLPVGFQTQLFLTNGSTDSHGHSVGNGDVTWSTSDASIVAVVDTTGVVTAKAVGTATITAKAKSDGTAAGTPIVTNVAVVGANARIGHNVDLGTPTDADASDDHIIARRQYTMSYNPHHGGPNWVSWNLDASHTGTSARCNCFTPDPVVDSLGFKAYDTNDWINGGIWSRGHMSPSADWADADGDNAPTFYLSNMLPQNQALNGGAWGNLEGVLRGLTGGTKEIYIMAGGIFTKDRSGGGVDGFGFMAGTGHIAVPDSVWKIAIVVPDGRSVDQIINPTDVQVIAAKFPNDASGTGTWDRYATTIDEIQKSTGYDFLSAIHEPVQCKIEVRDCAPTAALTSSISGNGWQTDEGQSVAFSASTSSDPDGDALTYTWSIDGVAAGSGATLTHTFANNGTFSVRVVVSDGKGGVDATSQTITVLNVAPTVDAFAGATILRGETYGAAGGFSDPGADTWTASVNYGDGSGTLGLPLSGTTFSMAHTYAAVGSFTVTVAVNDGNATSTATATVVVKSATQGISDLSGAIASAATANGFNRGQLNSLQSKLDNATAQLASGNTTPAANMLGAFLDEINADVRSGRLSAADAAPIIALAQRIIASINAP